MGNERSYQTKVINIQEEDTEYDIWPYKDSDGSWRIKTNSELNKLIHNKNIIS